MQVVEAQANVESTEASLTTSAYACNTTGSIVYQRRSPDINIGLAITHLRLIMDAAALPCARFDFSCEFHDQMAPRGRRSRSLKRSFALSLEHNVHGSHNRA